MLRAIVFDFDGIIVDAEPVHLKTFQEVLGWNGISLSEQEYYERYLALDDRTLFLNILRDRGINYDGSIIEDLMQKKSDSYEKLIRQDIKIFPGVIDFVNSAYKKYLLGIGSGALKHEIEFILDYIGIRDRFSVIVSAEDVHKCKPDPEVFVKTLLKINKKVPQGSKPIRPSECLVIEDSSAGIRAARAARMRTLAITNSYAGCKLAEANVVADSLLDVEIADLEELFEIP
ncbi:MAG: HAD family phosphatase [Thermodesulfobacteriota bacterium]